MRALAAAMLAACGTHGAAPAVAHRAEVAAEPRQLYRQLAVGDNRNVAHRTTFELSLEGDRAILVEIDERAAGAFTIERADREAAWKVIATHTYRGTRRANVGALELDLAAPGEQPLRLRCVAIAVDVAPAGADLVARHPAECHGDRGMWFPSELTTTPALVCSAAGQPAGADDDDDRLVFAAAPGIEWASYKSDCMDARGLRAMRR
jgi:hypothetical protein